MNPKLRCAWEEKILLCKSDEKKMLSVLQSVKGLKSDDLLHLYNLVLDNVETDVAVSVIIY